VSAVLAAHGTAVAAGRKGARLILLGARRPERQHPARIELLPCASSREKIDAAKEEWQCVMPRPAIIQLTSPGP
jgi:hypothetical protein